MVNMDRGPRFGPIDPKAVKHGAEQEDFRRVRPLDEARFLVGRVWAGVRWPFAMVGRLVRRDDRADEERRG